MFFLLCVKLVYLTLTSASTGYFVVRNLRIALPYYWYHISQHHWILFKYSHLVKIQLITAC